MVDHWTLVDGVWRLGASARPLWSQNGIPPVGTVITGIDVNGRSQSDLTNAETAVGESAQGWRAYYTGSGSQDEDTYLAGDIAWCHGRSPFTIPVVTLKPANSLSTTWANLATGAGDSWAATQAATMGAASGPVWMGLHHEPENDGPSETDFIAMQERLLPYFRAYDNIATSVNFMGYHQVYGADTWDTWLPDPSLVDLVLFDPYNFYGDVTGSTSWNEIVPYIDDFVAWLATKDSTYQHLRWGIAETGYTDAASNLADPPGSPGPGEEWPTRVFDYAVANGATCLFYFDIDTASTWRATDDVDKAAQLAYWFTNGTAYPG